MIVQVLAAAIGTVSFALIFGVPRKYYALCAVTGAAGWFLYLLLTNVGASATESIFFATALVALLSRFFAVASKCPVTVFLISGIIVLVPGGSIYWTAFYLVTNETQRALESGVTALRLAVAIVFGIVVILELPNKWFHLKRKNAAGEAIHIEPKHWRFYGKKKNSKQ